MASGFFTIVLCGSLMLVGCVHCQCATKEVSICNVLKALPRNLPTQILLIELRSNVLASLLCPLVPTLFDRCIPSCSVERALLKLNVDANRLIATFIELTGENPPKC